MEQSKQIVDGGAPASPSDPSAVAVAPSAEAADQRLQAPSALTHGPQFGDVWSNGRHELVILRCVGDDLYLTADHNGNRHYLNTKTGGYAPGKA